jgi:nicotinate-nucleotide adenylyltransferase
MIPEVPPDPQGRRPRWGLFGGSFDPVHRGHVVPVQAAQELLGLDRVLYLPTGRPPHKQAADDLPTAPASARFTMVELALLDAEGLYADDLEITAAKPSYTVETLERFRGERPEVDLHLVIGADSFVQLDRWHRWREIPDLARLVVLARPGWKVVPDRLPERLAAGLASGEIVVVRDRTVDLSSTEIRARLASGGAPEADWLPPLVVDYIRKYRFYGPEPAEAPDTETR